jgi:hypothetical protein
MSQQLLMRDLVNNFDQRLARLMLDTLDTCERGDLNRVDSVVVALGAVSRAIVRLALSVEMTEPELHHIIGEYYRAFRAEFPERSARGVRHG